MCMFLFGVSGVRVICVRVIGVSVSCVSVSCVSVSCVSVSCVSGSPDESTARMRFGCRGWSTSR